MGLKRRRRSSQVDGRFKFHSPIHVKAVKAAAIACLVSAANVCADAADLKVIPGSNSKPPLIVIEGDIQKGDDSRFRAIASQHSDANVLLDSDGGAIIPAMDIGRTIRLREYNTVVYKDGRCVSACALIWVAGEKRFVFQGGRVGFHASYLDVDGKQIETGMGNALVGHYLSQLGLGQKAVMFATAAPPDKVLWLDADTASLSAIEYELIPTSDRANLAIESRPVRDSGPPVITTVAPAPSAPQTDLTATQTNYRRWLATANANVKNVDAFAQGLRQMGYRAELDSSDPSSPKIFTGVGGNKVAIFFSSCAGRECKYAEILSSWFKIDPSRARAVVKSWNSEENFSSVLYTDTDETVSMYHYVLIGTDGITIQNLIENLEYFSRDYQNIGTQLAGGK